MAKCLDSKRIFIKKQPWPLLGFTELDLSYPKSSLYGTFNILTIKNGLSLRKSSELHSIEKTKKKKNGVLSLFCF